METILLDYVDGLTAINLNRGKANPINHTMVKELTAVLKDLHEMEEVKGVIITGKENFFSAGLDLPELYEYDKIEFQRFWRDFIQMITDFMMFDKPLVADITGHSPAGGTVIALGCDYKVMAAGNYKIGLNEIPVGLIVPRLIYEGYAFHLGHKKAYNYIMGGKLYSPDEALAIGLVDELAMPDQTYGKAVQAIERYLSFDQTAWRETKKNTKIAALKPYAQMSEESLDMAMELWWQPSTREKMAAFIAGLKKK
jgi:Delta3-Delta2-enoyl-CoA isomerase